jgi:predicted 3-demethylubiquinone-9 3-methyltransferase (glyoxalase superfamily)
MQKITPHLWFDKNAEEAAQFYTSVFKGGKILNTARYPEAGHEIHGMEPGSIMTVEFEIEGYRMIALNGGPVFTFTPAISFMVHCASAEKVDELWTALFEGGSALMPLDSYPFSERYGWLRDKYGVTWQIIYAKDAERGITPSFLFVGEKAGKAKEAIEHYASTFKDSSIGALMEYGENHPYEPAHNLMHGEFTLAGQPFSAMDSSLKEHAFSFNEAISLLVSCEDQAEIDHYWEKLSAVPESEMCGWLKDAYGVSWQIAPAQMNKIMTDPDTEKRERAMAAMMKMKKIDIAALDAA